MKKEKEQILIIGLGKFGMNVAKELSQYDVEVMAIDESSELVDEASKYVTHAARVDAEDIEALRKLGIREFDVAIIGIGDNIESSLMIALTLKELNIPYIIAKSRDKKQHPNTHALSSENPYHYNLPPDILSYQDKSWHLKKYSKNLLPVQ